MTDGPYAEQNLQEYSVSDLSYALKRTVEDRFGYVRVRGELSGVKFHSSGHLYLALKDDKAALDGVCWRGTAQRLEFKPEDGLEVICTGKLSTYPARSKYQIVIEHMEPAGAGALMALLEERKKKLAAEGLFEADRKRPIPYLPEVIGVVTSPTGSVIRDILHRLGERFPRHVLVWPVAVQGERAAEQIAAAITGFNDLSPAGAIPRPDVLIVARGGGSIEDLWPFNEENVVRATASSAIPLISAVGHETDTTLIDFAADLRAPTPTAAAEKAVPVLSDLAYTVADFVRRLDRARRRFLQDLTDRLISLGRALPKPKDILGLAQQRLDDLSGRLDKAPLIGLRDKRAELARVDGVLKPSRLIQLKEFKAQSAADLGRRLERARIQDMRSRRDRLSSLGRVLEGYSYHATLARGFAVLRDRHDTPVTSVETLKPGMDIAAELHDGRRRLRVSDLGPPGRSDDGRKTGRAKFRKARDDRQGSLL